MIDLFPRLRFALLFLFIWATILTSPVLERQAHATRASVIYGDDGRMEYYETGAPWRTLADSTVALMRVGNLEERGRLTLISTIPYGTGYGLCPEERFYDQDTAASCSGFLVRPDVVVTAGHCLSNQSACDNTRFVFGFRLAADGDRPRSVLTARVFRCQKLIHTVTTIGEDFAIARLDRPVTHVQPLPLRSTGRISPGDPLLVMGHPFGLPLKVADGARVRSVLNEYFVANLDTYGGNSGSAVFNRVTREVEGILVRGERDFKYANNCRVSNICPEDGCRGEEVTLIERVLMKLDPGNGNPAISGSGD